MSDDFWQAILILLQKDFDSTLNEALIFWDLDEYIWFNLKRIDFESSTGEIFFRDFQRRLVETGDSHFSDPLTYFKVLLFAQLFTAALKYLDNLKLKPLRTQLVHCAIAINHSLGLRHFWEESKDSFDLDWLIIQYAESLDSS